GGVRGLREKKIPHPTRSWQTPKHAESDTKINRTQYFVFDINFCIAYKVLHAYEHMQGGRAPCTHSL
ncbi:MAG: hypothetical protein ACTIBJ_22925, partial [Pseudomonas helleri]